MNWIRIHTKVTQSEYEQLQLIVKRLGFPSMYAFLKDFLLFFSNKIISQERERVSSPQTIEEEIEDLFSEDDTSTYVSYYSTDRPLRRKDDY